MHSDGTLSRTLSGEDIGAVDLLLETTMETAYKLPQLVLVMTHGQTVMTMVLDDYLATVLKVLQQVPPHMANIFTPTFLPLK